MLDVFVAFTALATSGVATVEMGSKRVDFLSGDSARAYMLSETEFEAFNGHLDLSLRVEEDLSGLPLDEVADRARSYFAAQVLDWTDQERAWTTDMLTSVHERMGELYGACRVPERTVMLKTTGAENFDVFYTIGEAIVYPQTNFRFVRIPPRRQQLEETLAHEYWHILSRQDEALRDEAYAVFGFEPGKNLVIPRSIAERRIHNPDVRDRPYVLTLGAGPVAERVVLLLVSKYPTYDGKKGIAGRLNTVLGYAEVRIFPVDPDGTVRDEPREIDDLVLERIGRISSYRFGADEIVAEAFEALYASDELDDFDEADRARLNKLRSVLTCTDRE
jgi:hypothetical protein